MEQHLTSEVPAYAAIIDTSTKKNLDRESLIQLLRRHKVRTSFIEKTETNIEDIISVLRKAKTNLPHTFFKDLASKMELPYIKHQRIRELYQEKKNSELLTILPYPIIVKYKIIPISIKGTNIELAVDNPLDPRVLVAAKYLFGTRIINLNVASTKSIEWAIDKIYNKIHKDKAMLDLYNRSPDQSAYRVVYPKQKYLIIAAISTIIVGSVISPLITLIVLFSFVSFVYFIVNPVKIYVSFRGFRGARTSTSISDGRVSDKDLPTYTILIPVFHEAEVLAQILRNIYRINYPKEKLDIKILMEEKDEETIAEAKLLGLFGSAKKFVEGIPKKEYIDFLKCFDPIIVPAAKITTKPRACNYGLLRSKGKLCVIYDAEDDPNPDQLRKAATVFLNSSKDVACLQSKLNFYNADENILTKWFSIEYANWFEFYLQGLDWIEAPIPLGGTSNHFRKECLDALGRWDPYNVTEDADIGIRLARQKLKTEIIDSYTYEEATKSIRSWVKQRSRWYKGHLQTYLVHMRNPAGLLKDLGLAKFAKLQLTFGAGVFMPVINPLLWIFTAVAFLVPAHFSFLSSSILQLICITNLLIGNLSYLAIYTMSCMKLKKNRLIPYALVMPLYWALLSIASWRGLIQLIINPFYWDKTKHGLTKLK